MEREELRVTRSEGGFVRPCEPTPSGVVDLSVIDKLAVLRCNARTLHVFKNNNIRDDHDESEVLVVVDVIREALSKALVPYYPLAGRLTATSTTNGGGEELQVSCTGEGVWFVEAFADCTLRSVSYFDDDFFFTHHSVPIIDKLLPPPPNSINIEGHHHEATTTDPLVLMQVTKFGCGGYVIGLIFCHSICDGLGAAQFLNAVGEFARGLHQLTVEPLWHRHFLNTPHSPSKHLPPPPPPIFPNYLLEQTNIDIPFHRISLLKQKIFQHHSSSITSTSSGTCSSFEIVAASMWSCRTKAINFSKDTQVKLVFFANCRHLLNPPLPKGFYGNCFFPVTITASSDQLVHSSLAQVVLLIQEAKARLPTQFHKWAAAAANTQHSGEDPFAPPLAYTTLFISEWGRLGFNQVDYGHGPPVHVVPIQGSPIIPVGIVGSLPLPNKGLRLLTWCVQKPHHQSFLHHMTSLFI